MSGACGVKETARCRLTAVVSARGLRAFCASVSVDGRRGFGSPAHEPLRRYHPGGAHVRPLFLPLGSAARSRASGGAVFESVQGAGARAAAYRVRLVYCSKLVGCGKRLESLTRASLGLQHNGVREHRGGWDHRDPISDHCVLKPRWVRLAPVAVFNTSRPSTTWHVSWIRPRGHVPETEILMKTPAFPDQPPVSLTRLTMMVLSPVFLLGCNGDGASSPSSDGSTLDKSSVYAGKADGSSYCQELTLPPGCDICATLGWYRDGECDEQLVVAGHCHEPDPDCHAPSPHALPCDEACSHIQTCAPSAADSSECVQACGSWSPSVLGCIASVNPSAATCWTALQSCLTWPAVDPASCRATADDFDLCIADGLTAPECVQMWGIEHERRVALCCARFSDEQELRDLCAATHDTCTQLLDDQLLCTSDGLTASECLQMWGTKHLQRTEACCLFEGSRGAYAEVCAPVATL